MGLPRYDHVKPEFTHDSLHPLPQSSQTGTLMHRSSGSTIGRLKWNVWRSAGGAKSLASLLSRTDAVVRQVVKKSKCRQEHQSSADESITRLYTGTVDCQWSARWLLMHTVTAVMKMSPGLVVINWVD
nr:hypothetical protein CFP56_02847 [Quercus suber]